MSAAKDYTERFDALADTVMARYGYAWIALMTPAVQRALVAEEILYLATAQDDGLPAETVREIVDAGWDYLVARFPH